MGESTVLVTSAVDFLMPMLIKAEVKNAAWCHLHSTSDPLPPKTSCGSVRF